MIIPERHAPRPTRYSPTVFERAGWGREEVTVEEVRTDFGLDPPHWRIQHHGRLWDRTVGLFILPDGKEQWAAIRYPTAEDALAEAPCAAGVALARYAERLLEHDTERAVAVGKRSNR